MRLAFNIETREEKEYLLSEEDSKKVMDKAFEIAKEKQYNIRDDENYLSYFIECATQLLLNNGEIEGVLMHTTVEEELTAVWEEEQ